MVTELKPEQELALTLLLPMVVLAVLGRLLKRDLADQKEIVQVCSYYLNIIDNSRRDNNNYISTLLHYILYVYSLCVHQVCTRCSLFGCAPCDHCSPGVYWGVHQVCTRCAAGVHQVCTRCAPGVHQVCTRCAPGVYWSVHQMCTRCAELHYQTALYVNYWIISKHFPEFRLVDQNGNKVGARVEGLLLSNGGTVCDHGFSDNSADAICREMGFLGRFSWRSGIIWNSFRANLDFSFGRPVFLCRSGEFTSCTYNLEHICGNYDDVLLACDTNNTGEWAIRSAEELLPRIRADSAWFRRTTCFQLGLRPR